MRGTGGSWRNSRFTLGVKSQRAQLFHFGKMNISGLVEDTEAVQQPEDYHDHDDDVEDLFDRPLHRNVGVDQPEDYANDNQGNDYVY